MPRRLRRPESRVSVFFSNLLTSVADKLISGFVALFALTAAGPRAWGLGRGVLGDDVGVLDGKSSGSSAAERARGM